MSGLSIALSVLALFFAFLIFVSTPVRKVIYSAFVVILVGVVLNLEGVLNF